MQPDHVTNLAGKTAVGASAAVAAVTTPSDYVSFFDRVYNWGWIVISGDDLSKFIGMGVGVLLSINIVYTIIKDVRERGKRRDTDDLTPKE